MVLLVRTIPRQRRRPSNGASAGQSWQLLIVSDYSHGRVISFKSITYFLDASSKRFYLLLLSGYDCFLLWRARSQLCDGRLLLLQLAVGLKEFVK